MDAFEKGLSRGIPMEKAAAFFVGLKSWQQPPSVDVALVQQCEKFASLSKEALTMPWNKPAPLLPSSGEMQQARVPGAIDPAHTARSGKVLPVAQRGGKVQNTVGGVPAPAAPAAAPAAGKAPLPQFTGSAHLNAQPAPLPGSGIPKTSVPPPAMRAPSALANVPKPAAAGGAAGGILGQAKGMATNVMGQAKGLASKAWATPMGKAGLIGAGALGAGMLAKKVFGGGQQQQKMANAQLKFKKLAAMYKSAAEGEAMPDAEAGLTSPTPNAVAPEQEYLEQEQAGLEAEGLNAVQYYQQLLAQMREENQAATAAAQEAESTAEQLKMQQAEHDQQVQGAQQEMQLAQQAAMSQVQQANAMATEAMQHAVDAENRALTSKSQETTAKIQQQTVRSQLFDLASQGLPGSEPQLGEEGNAAQGLQPEQDPQQAAGQSMDPNAPQSPPPPASPAPAAEVGQEATAAASPDAGGLNEQGQPANAEGMPGNEAPQAGGAAASGTAPQPSTDSSGGAGSGSGTGPQSKTDGQPSSPLQDPSAKRQGGVSIKVGSTARLISLMDRLERQKTANAFTKYLSSPAGIGAMTGSAAGFGATALEARGHGPDLGK